MDIGRHSAETLFLPIEVSDEYDKAPRSKVHRGLATDTGLRWSGVDVREYKSDDSRFSEITRQVLLGSREGLSIETRYFEIAAGGYSSLERHEHTHAVVVIRGRGVVLIDSAVHEIAAPDCVFVAPRSLHQFHAGENEALGFLCIVQCDRDRPCPATPSEVEALRSNPATRAWVKT